MKQTRLFFSLLPVLFIFTINHAFALDPLRINIRTDLPKKIKTIGAAAQYYADVAGYQIKTTYPAPQYASVIASEELNMLALVSETKPIDEAILSLLGEGCILVVDHEHKLISFDIKEDLQVEN